MNSETLKLSIFCLIRELWKTLSSQLLTHSKKESADWKRNLRDQALRTVKTHTASACHCGRQWWASSSGWGNCDRAHAGISTATMNEMKIHVGPPPIYPVLLSVFDSYVLRTPKIQLGTWFLSWIGAGRVSLLIYVTV